MNLTKTHRGLPWLFKSYKPDGALIERVPALNLVPTEGLNHMLGVTLHGVSPVPTWYILLWEGNYTPTEDVTAATLPGLATECVAYSSATRPEFVEGAVSGGAVSNAASLAVLTFTAAKRIYGGALVSASAKGSTAGVVLSAVRLPSPKDYDIGDRIEIFVGPSAHSA